jgi:hypothetical protein
MRRVTNLDYNVMEHAQKTIFVYGQNGQVHILLQQTLRVRSLAQVCAIT